MSQLLAVTFRSMPHSLPIECVVRTRAASLGREFPEIQECRVVVETPHLHHRDGKIFRIELSLQVAKHRLTIDEGADGVLPDVDPFIALRHAFRAARRRLSDARREAATDPRVNTAFPRGHITRLLTLGDVHSGFLRTTDGREVYFEDRAVFPTYAKLVVGKAVRFIEETGDNGSRAAAVMC